MKKKVLKILAKNHFFCGNFQSKITPLFWTYLKNDKEKICFFYRDLPPFKILALISGIPCL